jgi:oligoendopeptidase F
VAEATAFATPELLRIGLDVLRDWIQDPALPDRERWLARLETEAPHVRSEEVEALLSAELDELIEADNVDRGFQ